MKIIDEKGRLFGKINLIDLLVIVLVVAVVAAVGWKLVGKKAAASVSDNTHEMTFTVLFEVHPHARSRRSQRHGQGNRSLIRQRLDCRQPGGARRLRVHSQNQRV